jgi:hypothetical protein
VGGWGTLMAFGIATLYLLIWLTVVNREQNFLSLFFGFFESR